ncbi:hypothetical protein GPN2_21458 [Streptomyces murinus]
MANYTLFAAGCTWHLPEFRSLLHI